MSPVIQTDQPIDTARAVAGLANVYVASKLAGALKVSPLWGAGAAMLAMFLADKHGPGKLGPVQVLLIPGEVVVSNLGLERIPNTGPESRPGYVIYEDGSTSPRPKDPSRPPPGAPPWATT